jgi:ACS family hexuronate transporter-like MFS transporter
MGMISGWTSSYSELLVCRLCLGFFEAGHWPCALKTTFALLDEKDRTMGNSVLQSGASIGAIITPQIMKALMTDDIGSWRGAFVIVGAVGLGWVVVWFISMRPRELETAPLPEKASGGPGSLAWILSRRFWALALLITGTQTVWHIYRVWMMKFLQTGRGYSEAAALNFQSAYYIATDVGCILAGVISIWLAKRGLEVKIAVEPGSRTSIEYGWQRPVDLSGDRVAKRQLHRRRGRRGEAHRAGFFGRRQQQHDVGSKR